MDEGRKNVIDRAIWHTPSRNLAASNVVARFPRAGATYGLLITSTKRS